MWDEAELSDDDLRSVYGEEALLMRIRATIEDYEQKLAETTRTLAALYQKQDTPEEASS